MSRVAVSQTSTIPRQPGCSHPGCGRWGPFRRRQPDPLLVEPAAALLEQAAAELAAAELAAAEGEVSGFRERETPH